MKKEPLYVKRTWNFWVVTGYVIIVLLFCIMWLFAIISPYISPYGNSYRKLELESVERLTKTVSAALPTMSSAEIADYLQRIGPLDSCLLVLVDAKNGEVLASSEKVGAAETQYYQRITEDSSWKQDDYWTASDSGSEKYYMGKAASCADGTDLIVVVSTEIREIQRELSSVQIIALGLNLTCLLLASFIAYAFYSLSLSSYNRIERMRTEFVANASHELKTPVTGIKLLSETLQIAAKKGNMEVVENFSERIDKESTRLGHLIEDLIDLSRLESSDFAGKQKHKESSAGVDFKKIVLSAFKNHWVLADAKGLNFRLHDDTPSDACCLVDIAEADALMIINNLLDNAITYTQEGTVEVGISVSTATVKVWVSDSGCGITAQEKERIFERFYRVEKTKKMSTKGTGLGLSLVRNATVPAGGTITVDSDIGKGSTFTVTLPLLLDDPDSETE